MVPRQSLMAQEEWAIRLWRGNMEFKEECLNCVNLNNFPKIR